MKDNIEKEISNSEAESRQRRMIISESGAARRASDRVLANASDRYGKTPILPTERATKPKLYCSCIEPQPMHNRAKKERFLVFCIVCKLLIKTETEL